MRWIVLTYYVAGSLLHTSFCKKTRRPLQNTICDVYVTRSSNWSLSFNDDTSWGVPQPSEQRQPLSSTNTSFHKMLSSVKPIADETLLNFISFRDNIKSANVEVRRLCILATENFSIKLEFEAHWSSLERPKKHMMQRNTTNDCFHPQINIWQHSLQAHLKNTPNISDTKLNRKSRHLRTAREYLKLNDNRIKFHIKLIKKDFRKRSQLPKKRQRKKYHSKALRRLQRKRMLSIRKKNNNTHRRKKSLKVKKSGRRRTTRSLPSQVWLETYRICSAPGNMFLFDYNVTDSAGGNAETTDQQRENSTVISLLINSNKLLVETKLATNGEELPKEIKKIYFSIQFLRKATELKSSQTVNLSNSSSVGSVALVNTSSLDGTGTKSDNKMSADSIVKVCLVTITVIVILSFSAIICTCFRRNTRCSYTMSDVNDTCSDTEWTELSSDGCREVALDQNLAYQDMTQNKNCCCAKYKDHKATTRLGLKSQYTTDISTHCQHQSKPSRRQRKKRDSKLCCCGKRLNHMTSESRATLSSLTPDKRINGAGLLRETIKPDQSSFSKYNGLINNPHRQEYPMSRSLLSMQIPPVHMRTSNRRFPKQSNTDTSSRASIESTCVKPPPNRTILKNDGLSITTCSRNEYLVSDENVAFRQADEKFEHFHSLDKLPKYSRNDSCSFSAVNVSQQRGAYRDHKFESISSLPTEATGIAIEESPPEYSEPPAYYA